MLLIPGTTLKLDNYILFQNIQYDLYLNDYLISHSAGYAY